MAAIRKAYFTISLLSLFLHVSAFADTEIVNGITWTYTISNGGATVKNRGYNSPAISTDTQGDIEIPPVLGGCPVVTIGEGAFMNCTKITSCKIPDSVTRIENYAFLECSGLEALLIPDSVTYMGPYTILGRKNTNMKVLFIPSRFSARTDIKELPSTCVVRFYDAVSLLSITTPYGNPNVFGSDYIRISDGVYVCVSNDVIECSMSDAIPDQANPEIRHSVSGWRGTGSVSISGSFPYTIFRITQDSTLEWMWTTNAHISVSVSNGACDTPENWGPLGSVIEASITPVVWPSKMILAGDTNGIRALANSLIIPVDGPRSISVDCVPIEPQTEFVDGVEWSFVVIDDSAIVFGGTERPAIPPTTTGAVSIPDSLGGFPVVGFADDAFAGCSGITRLMFPGDAPDTVADDAFDGVDGNCTIHVRADADGWGDTFPGTWHGLTIMNDLRRLTTSVVGGGAVAGGGDFVSGDDAELIAYATDGFVFAYWTGDVASVSSNLTVTVVYDTTATAVFVPVAAADNLVQQRAEQNGYYTRDQIHELAIGNLMFDVDAGKARIGVKLMESSDLTNPDGWIPVELSASDLDIGDDGSVGMSVNAEDGVRFFRLEAP